MKTIDLKRSPVFLLRIVSVRRVKVSNQLYKKSDGELFTAGETYYQHMLGDPVFVSLQTILGQIRPMLDDFKTAISKAANGGKDKVSARNAKRVVLINKLASLSNSVEDIANKRENAHIGADVIISKAGMRVRPFTKRGKQVWEVMRGRVAGSLYLTAAHVRPGAHIWQWTLDPTDEHSWKDAKPGLVAHVTITGLPSGKYVYCRHRTITNAGYSDWEGHDPVITG